MWTLTFLDRKDDVTRATLHHRRETVVIGFVDPPTMRVAIRFGIVEIKNRELFK